MAREEGTDEETRRVWYAPWRKKKVHVRRVDESQGQFPDEWLTTDIRKGLETSEVTARRQRSGWNELAAQKENPIAKVLAYFRGPILYGKISLPPQARLGFCGVALSNLLQSWNWPFFWLLAWRTGLTLASSLGSCVLMLL